MCSRLSQHPVRPAENPLPRSPIWAVPLALVWSLIPSTAFAGDLEKVAPSLKWVPADAAFYHASFRLGEQCRILADSRAWARLKSLPAYKLLQEKTDEALKHPNAAQLKQFLDALHQPENHQLLETLRDMCSTEIFTYGGKSFVDFSDILVQVFGAMRYGPALENLTGPRPLSGPFGVMSRAGSFRTPDAC
jgi:hypothetical protein